MDDIYGELIKLGFTILTVMVVPLVTAILIKVLKRIGLSVSAEQQAKLEKLAQDAILATEEYASARIKAQLVKLLPAEKLTKAVELLMDKVPGITPQEATLLVQQELPKLRASAAGFLLAATTAASTGS